MRYWLLFFAIISLADAYELSAQDRLSTSALHFARAILTGFPFGGEKEPEYLLEQLPPNLAPNLPLLPASRAIGAFVYESHSFSMVDLAPGANRFEEWVKLIETKGWVRDRTKEIHGFAAGPIRSEAKLCMNDSTGLTLGQTTGSDGEIHVAVFHVTDMIYADCKPRIGESAQPGDARPESPVPALVTPTGTRMYGGGSSSSSGDGDANWQHYGNFDSQLSTIVLLGHFAKQLTDAGWKVGEAGTTRGAAIAAIQFTDAKGQSWYGNLAVSEQPGGPGRNASVVVKNVRR